MENGGPMGLSGYDLDGTLCSVGPKRDKPYFRQSGKERAEFEIQYRRHCREAARPVGEL